MKNKKLIVISGVISLLVIIFLFSRGDRKKTALNSDDLRKGREVLSEDYYKLFSKIKFDDKKIKELFSRNVANKDTIKFFKFLGREFSNLEGEEHLEAVKKYLYSKMDPDKAEETFALYKKYKEYLVKVTEMQGRLPMPKDYDQMQKYLDELQVFRREFFGTEVADSLFGEQYKKQSFHIQKSAVVVDKELYGKEKEKRISEIRKEMWGGENYDDLRKPYDKYVEKQRIYERDLSELSDEKRQEKIIEFRKEYFTPEVVERMAKVDNILKKEEQQEKDYRNKTSDIMNDRSLSDEEKSKKIRALQDDMFGDRADAFRRREKIRIETERLRNR